MDKKKTNINTDNFGKIPPQNIEIEEVVLGAILLERTAFEEVQSLINGNVFYKESNKTIFQAAEYLYKKNEQIDVLTVSDVLRKKGEMDSIGGPVYLSELTNKIVSSANIVRHSLLIKEAYIKREIIRIGSELQSMGFDTSIDLSDILDYAEREMFSLGENNTKKEAKSILQIYSKLVEMIEKREKQKNTVTGIPSGIIELDRMTLGWQGGDLIILAARPSMGKSALALQFASFASENKYPTIMFSLEMTEIQLAERLLSTQSGHDNYDIKSGRNIDWNRIEKAIRRAEDMPLYIDDSPTMTIYEFRSKVRRAIKRYGIKMVVCDYLNLFKGDEAKENMSEVYGSISKMFKSVAKECNIPVIGLAQLNRSPDSRTNSFPKLSDLRNSGEIEQDADIVIFPVRYGAISNKERDDQGRNIKEWARIDVAKNRNGKTGDFEVRISPDCMVWGIPDQYAEYYKETTEPDKFIQSNEPPF